MWAQFSALRGFTSAEFGAADAVILVHLLLSECSTRYTVTNYITQEENYAYRNHKHKHF